MVIWEMTISKYLIDLSASDDQIHIHAMHWPLILVKFTLMLFWNIFISQTEFQQKIQDINLGQLGYSWVEK